jgi:DNA-binding transcriptional LysR family regulator
MLDIRRLRLLRELNVRGTLAGVAAALNQSPSSVSQQLAQLEREVGVKLLRKSGRKVQLTSQAELLVEHTGAVLERLELAESELAASRTTVAGTVRIVVFQSAALALMPQTLSILRAEYPQLRIEMFQREPETALHETWARDFDLALAEQYPGHSAPHHPELDRVPLATDSLRLAVPPSGRSWAEVRSIADAARSIWVMEPRGAAARHWAELACREAGFEPDVRFETADLLAQNGLIESGNAVGLMPDLLWTARPTSATLHELPGRPRRTIFTAARRASALRPAIVACREVLARVTRIVGLPEAPAL